MTKPANLRTLDPHFAAFMDGLREAFGAEHINAIQRQGLAGIPNKFHYKGHGVEVGTPFTPPDPKKTFSPNISQFTTPAHAHRNHRS